MEFVYGVSAIGIVVIICFFLGPIIDIARRKKRKYKEDTHDYDKR